MKNLAPIDGELCYIESFIPPSDTGPLFQQLVRTLAWNEEKIAIVGKKLKVPRLMCWYGDPEAIYTYSGATHIPLPWIPVLTQLQVNIEHYLHKTFNSVLGNLYRDGQDSMGWHADNEKELGRNPTIASLSLGEERLFKIRHRKTKETVDLHLKSGSLLIMSGELQHHWRHCIPKTRVNTEPRINLTFRKILITQKLGS